MSGNVKQFVDFSSNTNNDTGENNAASIQPMADGEVVTGAVLARPSESLRQRTEAVRDVMADTLYLRDADRGWIITGPRPTITWPGSTTASASGIPVLGNALWVMPMLTPGSSGNTPPVASVFGVLHLKRSSDSSNAVSVTSRRRSYAAGDQINVTVASGAAFSCVLDVETGLRRTIKIVATASTTLGTIISALNALTPPAPDNTQLVTAALEGGALSGDFVLAPQAKQFVSGNYDGEAHLIGVSTVSGFFASNPTQALAEGDTLCVRYDAVSDPSSTGGRRQSIPENANVSLPSGSLFNSRVHPEFLPNAIPICKVVNNDLVFPGGRTIFAGSTGVSLAGNQASDAAYGGGVAWADTTANPATTVENQLDKILTDLTGATGGGSGAAKIHAPAIGTDLAAGTVGGQLLAILSGLLDLNRLNVPLEDTLGRMTIGSLAAIGDPDNPSQGPSGGPSTLWAYALTLGGACVGPGSTTTKVKITPGVLMQKITGSAPTFLMGKFDGTDEFTIPNGHATLDRIDMLQMRLQTATAAAAGFENKRVVTKTLSIKSGTPSATPRIPDPDAGFVPIATFYVMSTWTGQNQAGETGVSFSSPSCILTDQRMPLRVRPYTAKAFSGGLYDAAIWVPSGGHFGRTLKCNTNTSDSQKKLIIPCPITRGRLVGVAISSQNAPAAAFSAVISALLEPSGSSEGPDLTSLLTSTSPSSYKHGGLLVLDYANASIVSLSGNYGGPLWASGSSMSGVSMFFENRIEPSGTTFQSSCIAVTFGPALNFEVAEVTFYIAEGLG